MARPFRQEWPPVSGRAWCLPSLAALVLTVAVAPGFAEKSPNRWFAIQVVDAQTGRGVPLVELRTTYNARYYTDSNGVVAFGEPGLTGQKVYFHVQSHGYEFPKDGFDNAGVSLDVEAGKTTQIKIQRRNIAERLYRLTGAGIYRDSVLAGRPVASRQPLLNAQVTGQDSAMAVVWRDRIWWFWGDTNRLRYPLGLFHVSGATSLLPGRGGLSPEVGAELQYFVDRQGFSRAMCPMERPGAVWIEGLLVLPDASGRECLVARYTCMKSLGEMLEHGLIAWDEKAEEFEKIVKFDLDQPWRCPRAHPIRVRDGGSDYFLFPTPYATTRVKAQWDRLVEQSSYEAFTCLTPGTHYEKGSAKVERDSQGRAVYAWKPNTGPLTAAQERELIVAKLLRPEEARFQPRDVETGKAIELHSGSIQRNAYRKKWILIAVELGGSSSLLGEVWYAEADTALALALGPQDHHARQVHLLQPGASRLLRRGRRPTNLLGRDVCQHVLRQSGPHALVRLQPDHVPARPVRPATA